jgi:hypothetical protein
VERQDSDHFRRTANLCVQLVGRGDSTTGQLVRQDENTIDRMIFFPYPRFRW